MSDYELVYLAQEKNEEALEELLVKYRPFIVKYINSVRILEQGISYDDLYLEGVYSLCTAIDSFDDRRYESFFTFFKTCLKNRISVLVRDSNRMKHKILNDSLSIDSLLEKGIDFSSRNYDDSYLNYEGLFQGNEGKIWDLLIKGYNIDDISYITKLSKKTIYNAIYRMKKKVSLKSN